MTFKLRKGAYQYRPLRKNHTGWDVVALQHGLLGVGYKLHQNGADGHFGAETDVAVKTFQTNNALVVDGIAGIATQRALGKVTIGILAGGNRLLEQLATGQTEAECGWQLGNYTAPYPKNQRRDMGPVQENLPKGKDGPPSEADCWFAFDTPARIGSLFDRYMTYFAKYYGKPGAQTKRRTYELAAGSHNAPAWTDKLAAGGTLTVAQSEHIEGYIDRVTSYVVW